MTTAIVATVVRERHPLRGRALRVLGRMRRHGRLELLLELPDGSKCLIPAAWTDLAVEGSGGGGPVPGLRPWGRWRTCWLLPGWLAPFRRAISRAGRRLRGSHSPRRTPVQPAQLSLLSDHVPAPPPTLVAQLPPSQVEAAITLLASLIAKACLPPEATAEKARGSADE